jgi:adenosylhomocysteinase
VAEYVYKHASELEKKVYDVPKPIDAEIARLKLETMGVKIDSLTDDQEEYLRSWTVGT